MKKQYKTKKEVEGTINNVPSPVLEKPIEFPRFFNNLGFKCLVSLGIIYGIKGDIYEVMGAITGVFVFTYLWDLIKYIYKRKINTKTKDL